MTIQDYKNKTLVILTKSLIVILLATVITYYIFLGAPIILLMFVGLNNGLLIYNIYSEFTYQLNKQYIKEFKERDKPLDNDG